MDDVLTGPLPWMLMSLVSVLLAWARTHLRQTRRPIAARPAAVEQAREARLPAKAEASVDARRQGMERWLIRVARRVAAAPGDAVALARVR